MSKLLSDILSALPKLINNSNYVNFLSIVVVAITSYHIAKYNASKPNKLQVKQAQLIKVYLPLHRIVEAVPAANISKQQALNVQRKISNVLDKNYELVFPQLHRLNYTLGKELLTNGQYEKTLKIIKHQIDVDYELLKRALGYPSENFYDIYRRMTFKQKATWIISWINVFLLFIPIGIMVSLYPHYLKNEFLLFVIMILATLLPLLVLIKINNWINNLPD